MPIRTLQLLLTVVQVVDAALLDGPEVRQHLHELPEVDAIVRAVGEERVHDAIDERINGQLGDAQEVVA